MEGFDWLRGDDQSGQAVLRFSAMKILQNSPPEVIR